MLEQTPNNSGGVTGKTSSRGEHTDEHLNLSIVTTTDQPVSGREKGTALQTGTRHPC